MYYYLVQQVTSKGYIIIIAMLHTYTEMEDTQVVSWLRRCSVQLAMHGLMHMLHLRPMHNTKYTMYKYMCIQYPSYVDRHSHVLKYTEVWRILLMAHHGYCYLLLLHLHTH